MILLILVIFVKMGILLMIIHSVLNTQPRLKIVIYIPQQKIMIVLFVNIIFLLRKMMEKKFVQKEQIKYQIVNNIP